MKRRYVVKTATARHLVEVRPVGDNYEVAIDGTVHMVDSHRFWGTNVRSLLIGGRSWEANTMQEGDRIDVYLSGELYPVEVYDEVWARAQEAAPRRVEGEEIQAPIPGSVVDVLAAPGDRVAAGAPVVVLEAMKMQNEILARHGGTVTEVRVKAGDTVAGGQVLIVLAAPEGEDSRPATGGDRDAGGAPGAAVGKAGAEIPRV